MKGEHLMEQGRGKLILVTGGARSGKSTFAENYALKSGKRVFYIATAAVDDEEMEERVRLHRENRPSGFTTFEERFHPHLVMEEEQGEDTLFLLDCLTILLSNHLLKEAGGSMQEELDRSVLEKSAGEALQYVSTLSKIMQKSPSDVLVVTNEVGMGIVPEHLLGRLYRDMAGRANQAFAAAADEVWLLVCGLPQRLK